MRACARLQRQSAPPPYGVTAEVRGQRETCRTFSFKKKTKERKTPSQPWICLQLPPPRLLKKRLWRSHKSCYCEKKPPDTDIKIYKYSNWWHFFIVIDLCAKLHLRPSKNSGRKSWLLFFFFCCFACSFLETWIILCCCSPSNQRHTDDVHWTFLDCSGQIAGVIIGTWLQMPPQRKPRCGSFQTMRMVFFIYVFSVSPTNQNAATWCDPPASSSVIGRGLLKAAVSLFSGGLWIVFFYIYIYQMQIASRPPRVYRQIIVVWLCKKKWQMSFTTCVCVYVCVCACVCCQPD